MRGSLRQQPFRAGVKPQPINEANGQTFTLPAPYGGWNANGNLSNMPATDAVQMDNFFPGITDVMTRRGCDNWVTNFPATVKRLMGYEGPLVRKLFASTDAGVFDATSAGTAGAAIFACSNGRWSYVNFSNSGGNFLVMVNGQDDMRVFDGSTWKAINAVSTPALTGVATSSLVYVNLFKKRLWFVENNSMNLWYLDADAFAGTAHQFPVGSLFTKGGKVVATGNWTLDNGSGQDDYFVILTSRGQAAVYQGTDPSSSTTWNLVGVYDVGIPVGDRPIAQYGGDLLIMTRNGLVAISQFIQSSVIDRNSSITVKIQGALLDFAEAYQYNYGWQTAVFRNGNFLLINVPYSVTQSFQCVMNLTTKAWCRFTNWNASAWEVFGDNLYFAAGSNVVLAWTGAADNGSPISATVVQAYNYLKYGGQKEVTLVRPHILVTGPTTVSYGMDTDFKNFGGMSMISYIIPNGTGIWDTSHWDAAVWANNTYPIRPSWLTVPAELGYLHAFRLQSISSSANVTWTATNFLYRPAGVL